MLYFDHSATTPLHPEVLELMNAVAREKFGNPSSIHRAGQEARSVVETARRQMAAAIKAKPADIIFTGGGTESNNLVLWNQVYEKNRHVIISAIEHPAVYKTLDFLKTFNVETTVVPVSENGIVNSLEIENACRPDTSLVSIMLANNEVGSLQPIQEISSVCRARGIKLHTDAVQTPGKIPLSMNELGVDFASFSAHKFYGPKGVGALYVRSFSGLKGLIHGGGQERKLRAGTENVPGIAGLGLAAELNSQDLSQTQKHLNELSRYFRTTLIEQFPTAIFNGDPDRTLPGLVSVSLPEIKSDILTVHLNRAGIAVSTGSACSSGTIEPSHVLKAMNVSNHLNLRTLRISFGRDNTMEEVDILVNALVEARTLILKVSP